MRVIKSHFAVEIYVIFVQSISTMKSGNLLILQSGTPGFIGNNILYGMLAEALNYEDIEEIYGAYNGFEGIAGGHFIDLAALPQKKVQWLLSTSGYVLGSEGPSFQASAKFFDALVPALEKRAIKFVAVIASQEALSYVNELNLAAQRAQYDLQVIAVPHSDFNELPITDHSLGYGSCLKFLNATLTSFKHFLSMEKIPVGIHEFEGSNYGWGVAGSALSYAPTKATDNLELPYMVCLPEQPFNKSAFLSILTDKVNQWGSVIIITHPQLVDEEGQPIDLEGCGSAGVYLSQLIQDKLGLPIYLSCGHINAQPLSHFISKTDADEAIACGRAVLKQLINECETNKAVVLVRKSGDYNACEVSFLPVKDLTEGVKFFPSDWICEKSMTVQHSMIRYAQPLIQGEVAVPFEKGLPQLAQL